MYTATKIAKGFSQGQVCVEVAYVGDAGETTFSEAYRASTIQADWPDGIIRSRLTELNAINLGTITLGLPSVKPAVLPPTPAELDRAAFIALLGAYRAAKAEVTAGVGKSTQQTVDDLAVQIKATYKDEYAPLLVGVF